MKKTKTNQDSNEPQANGEKWEWSRLTDSQKAQLLLNTPRIPDAEIFLDDFKSFEEPQFTFLQTKKL